MTSVEESPDNIQTPFLTSIDHAAENATTSLFSIFRRLVVNGFCFLLILIPPLAIELMTLPQKAKVTFAIVGVFISAALWKVYSYISHEYGDSNETNDELHGLTFHFFLKRFAGLGAIIYGLIGVGYLISLLF